jgi:site-specific recombinase XerD
MPEGSLALYRRHLRMCKNADKGNRWTRCQCPIWVQGSIGGETTRRSLNTGNWTAASSIVHQWQSSGRIGVRKPDLPTVTEAVDQFLTGAAVRNLAATTIKKRRELLEGKLLPFCAHRGHRQLRDLTVEQLREFRRTWKYSPLSAAKRLEYLRAFLRFCVEAGWIERNPAAALKPTKVPHKPTLPYTDVEVERLSNCHPHRVRDTFAVSLPLKGVSLDSVSKLLGHSSIKITERHYAPWVKARQDQLESEVRRLWA